MLTTKPLSILCILYCITWMEGRCLPCEPAQSTTRASRPRRARPIIPSTTSCAALTRGGVGNSARTGGDAVAALRQTADRHTRGTAHGWQEGDVGTDSATPADWAAAPPHLNVPVFSRELTKVRSIGPPWPPDIASVKQVNLARQLSHGPGKVVRRFVGGLLIFWVPYFRCFSREPRWSYK